MYHFVWIPKYRHKVFIEPYRESLRLIIKKIGYDYNIEIVELEIPTDHIHMVVKSEPKVSPSYIMQIVNHPALQMQGLRLRHQCLSYS
ncbi:IS200/IS605 family transposase [Rickettsia endosymbiont of Nabis limbatus]|uniref:IS200/IS605 family transposase n=1 Tax=Rickettsia endosymbiont of Nabis limbatus TaxID=3066268 RepID=UPI003AF3DF83